MKRSTLIKRFLAAWPGKKYLGEYRFLPIFFFAGAGLEYFMIHWHFHGVNFYKTFKRRQVEELVEKRERQLMFEEHDIKIVIHN